MTTAPSRPRLYGYFRVLDETDSEAVSVVESCRSEDVPAVVALSTDAFPPTPEPATFLREELDERIKGTVFIAAATSGEVRDDD
ncbi:hypothetical protein [Streptomyces sp. NPDC046985]|uniref:hypothetical protein n=1 Tax=Streptomyces sp. NPDC046985 TaxID=3155377 RepID=UPI0033CEDA34